MIVEFVPFYLYAPKQNQMYYEREKNTYIIQTFYNILRIEMPWTCLIRPPVLDHVCGLRSVHFQSRRAICVHIQAQAQAHCVYSNGKKAVKRYNHTDDDDASQKRNKKRQRRVRDFFIIIIWPRSHECVYRKSFSSSYVRRRKAKWVR